jgi:uncharacterized protein YlxW (UPF0749 family)
MPLPTPEEIKTVYVKDKSWVLAHERLLIIVLAVAAVVFLGWKYLNSSSDAAIAKNAVAQEVLQQQVTQNQAITKQLATQVEQYQQMLSALTAQNASLLKNISQRQVAVQKQQQIDKTLPLPELGRRIEGLAGLTTPDVTPTAKGIELSEAGSRAIAQLLETVPVIQQEVKDLQAIVANKDTQIASLETMVGSLNIQVAGLKTELLDKDRAMKAAIDLEKAKARKSKIRYFLTGLGIGAGVASYLLLR